MKTLLFICLLFALPNAGKCSSYRVLSVSVDTAIVQIDDTTTAIVYTWSVAIRYTFEGGYQKTITMPVVNPSGWGDVKTAIANRFVTEIRALQGSVIWNTEIQLNTEVKI